MKNNKTAIFVEKIDKENRYLYSKFASYCINRIKIDTKIINKNELNIGDILISPFLFLKSENIIKALNFKEFDIVVLCETPIIDVLNAFEIPQDAIPTYDTRLVGFNNKELLEWWKTGKTDEELYEYCKKHNLKVKTIFSNIMVEDKMEIFGVQWIPQNIRKNHEIDIINFFIKKKTIK